MDKKKKNSPSSLTVELCAEELVKWEEIGI